MELLVSFLDGSHIELAKLKALWRSSGMLRYVQARHDAQQAMDLMLEQLPQAEQVGPYT